MHKIDHSYLQLFPDTSAASARLSDNKYSLCSTNVFPIPFCSENIVLRYCRSALSFASNFYLFLFSIGKCLLTGFVYSSQKWAPASTSTKTSTDTKKKHKNIAHTNARTFNCFLSLLPQVLLDFLEIQNLKFIIMSDF